MAPLAVRRSAYMNIGGMDESTSEPSECGENQEFRSVKVKNINIVLCIYI